MQNLLWKLTLWTMHLPQYFLHGPLTESFTLSLFIPGSHAFVFSICYRLLCHVQAFKHIFTSPSSVEKEVKATRSGNARIHGMTRVITASLAYVAMQVCRKLTI